MNFDATSLITKPILLRLAIGVGFVVSAVLITNVVWLVVDRPFNSPVFLGAIILSAWLVGFRSAILTSILSGIAMKYFFVVPLHQFTGDPQVMVRLTVFVVEGIILAALIERLRIASDRIRASKEELQALTEHQRTLREDEQKRIAREIHDELGQVLTTIKMDIHFLNSRITANDSDVSKAEISSDLKNLSDVVDGTISSVRRIASELRPSVLDDFGLVAAFEWQTQEFQRTTKITCIFRSDTNQLDLGAEANTAVFRIFQEALTNIARHANASKVVVKIRRTDTVVVVTVTDDGRGIDKSRAPKRSLGILGMNERSRLIGAELKIDSPPKGGTSVELRVPVGRDSGLEKS